MNTDDKLKQTIARVKQYPEFSDNWWCAIIYGCIHSHISDTAAGDQRTVTFDPTIFRHVLNNLGIIIGKARQPEPVAFMCGQFIFRDEGEANKYGEVMNTDVIPLYTE